MPFSLGRAVLRAAAIIGVLSLASGCASLPARSASGVDSTAVGSRTVAQAVDIIGTRGRLTAAQRERALKGVAAEGKAGAVQRHLAVMAAAGDVDLFTGNDVRLLVDGPAAFAAMFAAVEAAQSYVLLESYIIEDSSIADRMAALLVKKRAEGVAAWIIYDDIGSIGSGEGYFGRLQAAGVGTCAFNPVNPLKRPGYWSINHRDHRKILVVDGAVAFTGGINISEVYSSGSSLAGSGRGRKVRNVKEEGWRDTQISVRGPAVAPFEALFRQTWASQGCKPAMPAAAARPAGSTVAAGDKVVRVIASGPDEGEGSRIYSTLLSAIDAAQSSVHFTMAYFAPGRDMIDALTDAARRGVDVTLVLPSVSDFSLILEAGRSYYGELLAAGVRVHELQDAVLHAKTAVIDGVFSTVGSSNLDWRSFVGNNEVNAVVVGEDFGAEMEAMFQRDLKASTPLTAAEWQSRPMHRRFKEWLGRAFERLL